MVSPVTEEMLVALGVWAEGDDIETYMEAHGRQLQVDEDLVRATDDRPGWAILFDIENVPIDLLAHGAQYIGGVIPDGLTDAQKRTYVGSKPGFGRGRVSAIIGAARTYLKGTKFVNIVERDTSPYHYKIQMLASEMPTPTFGQLAAENTTFDVLETNYPTFDDISNDAPLNAALDQAKPAGLMYSIELL